MNSQNYLNAEPEKWNCTQSIFKGFQKEFNIPDSRIAEIKVFGGGRAPEGICGALFAAEILLAEQGKSSIKEKFKEKVGNITCLAIKREHKIPCRDCVRIADELLENEIKMS